MSGPLKETTDDWGPPAKRRKISHRQQAENTRISLSSPLCRTTFHFLIEEQENTPEYNIVDLYALYIFPKVNASLKEIEADILEAGSPYNASSGAVQRFTKGTSKYLKRLHSGSTYRRLPYFVTMKYVPPLLDLSTFHILNSMPCMAWFGAD